MLSHANTLRLASLRGGTTWQSSVAENQFTLIAHQSLALFVNGRRNIYRGCATLDCHVVPPRNDAGRRKVTDVARAGFQPVCCKLFFIIAHRLEVCASGRAISRYTLMTDFKSVPITTYSETHMTKVELYKGLYPNNCVYTRSLTSLGADFSIINTSCFASSLSLCHCEEVRRGNLA